MSVSSFNCRWAQVIIQAVTRHGVRHCCIAPGSRSTPLTLAAAQHNALTCHTHFDERGLGHLALGLAKASGQAVLVIVTSGTAVANLYPAVIEAGLSGERLILLTADRPPDKIDCGANQAIRQQGIFALHSTATINLPAPDQTISAAWIVSTLDNGLAKLQAGALHINCPFAEPLYGIADDTGLLWQQTLGDWWQSGRPWLHYAEHAQQVMQPDWPLWQSRRGLVIAGRITAQQGVQVAKWAATLGWPLISDVLSQTGQPLPCAELWLGDQQIRKQLSQAQIVIQFGGFLTGKRLLDWQASCQPEQYWLIDPLAGRLDPANHRGRRLSCSVTDWLQQHPAKNQPAWAENLCLQAHKAQLKVKQQTQAFGEAQVAARIADLLPENGQLFLGNSLVIRLVDALAQLPAGYPVYSNRGASGIDGLLSTSVGVQRASAKPTLVVLGDLSSLYDINALALLGEVPAPLVLLIINNNGGQIFSLLPTDQALRKRFYCMPHNLNFAHAAAMFSLNYHQPQNWHDLQDVMQRAWRRTSATVIELVVPQTAGAQYLRQLLAEQSPL